MTCCKVINRKLFTVKVFYFLSLSGVAVLLPYLPIFLYQIRLQTSEISIIFALNFFLTFLKNVVIGWLADRYQKHKFVLIISCFITGPALCLLLVVPSTRENVVTHNFTCTNASSNPAYTRFGDEFNFYYCDTMNICSEEPCHWEESNLTTGCAYKGDNLTTCRVAREFLNPPYTSMTFWLSLVLVLLGGLSSSNLLMLNDAIVYKIIGDDRVKWGKQRLWGSLGNGGFTLVLSLVIYFLGKDPSSIDYTPSFVTYLGLSLPTAAVAYYHPVSQNITCSQKLEDLPKLLRSPRVIAFLVVLFVLGVFNGVVIVHENLYIRTELKASQLVLGLIMLITVIVEVIILFFGGKVVEKIGAVPCLYFSFVAYAVRFLALNFIRYSSVWWSALIAVTHMFTFGLMFTAATMYASCIASEAAMGTMMGLINGIKWGLGLGTGSLIGGAIQEVYGYETLFIGLACSSGIFLVMYVLLNECVFRFCLVDSLQTSTDMPSLHNETDYVTATENVVHPPAELDYATAVRPWTKEEVELDQNCNL